MQELWRWCQVTLIVRGDGLKTLCAKLRAISLIAIYTIDFICTKWNDEAEIKGNNNYLPFDAAYQWDCCLKVVQCSFHWRLLVLPLVPLLRRWSSRASFGESDKIVLGDSRCADGGCESCCCCDGGGDDCLWGCRWLRRELLKVWVMFPLNPFLFYSWFLIYFNFKLNVIFLLVNENYF